MASAASPRLRQVILDTVDVRGIAELYRGLLGFAYRPATRSEIDWLAPLSDTGALVFQQVAPVEEGPGRPARASHATWRTPAL